MTTSKRGASPKASAKRKASATFHEQRSATSEGQRRLHTATAEALASTLSTSAVGKEAAMKGPSAEMPQPACST
eukprot:CAMPEP_0183572508 /NCGR_PEP_ID=MMETSP0371-20130417/128683_1 /TAXON_ID=268820 /ORGANISM="Peridinium aciculiferum, Strain PAER-2" /LENGTH=73 /DNA_ID=CAMNT_0025782365 /DNA_START=64 /DNA_END=282 /DNA_ORIENTATION=+